LGLFGNGGFLSSIEPVVSQRYHGDITIIPPFSILNYYYLFGTPSEHFVKFCIEAGRKTAWSKIPLIRNHLEIEWALEDCYEKLKQEVYHTSNITSFKRLNKIRKSFPTQSFEEPRQN